LPLGEEGWGGRETEGPRGGMWVFVPGCSSVAAWSAEACAVVDLVAAAAVEGSVRGADVVGGGVAEVCGDEEGLTTATLECSSVS
jgi:hypothetical protein